METETKKTNIPASLKDTNQWIRVLCMIFFVAILYVALGVLFLIAIAQALFSLFTGESNENVTVFGGKLSRYIYQITQFMTYNSEDKPFPWADWPEESVIVTSADDSTE
jgi:hypothetical protein